MNILKFFGIRRNSCKVLLKAFEKAKIKHQVIDVGENEELTDKYNVKSVSTVIVLNDEGEELGRFVGPRTKEQLLEELSKYNSIDNE